MNFSRKMLNLKILQTPEEIRQIQPLWDQLQSSLIQSTVFQSWDWCYSWIETYFNPDKHKLAVACCYDQKELVMLFPFFGSEVENEWIYSPIGYELADYSDVLVHPEYEQRFNKVFWKFINSFSGDKIYFRFLPSWSVINRILSSFSPRWIARIHSDNLFVDEIYSKIHLPEKWEDYESTLSRKNQKNLRRSLRQMENSNFSPYFPEEITESEIEEIIQFHIDSLYSNHGILSSFQDPKNKLFLAKVIKRLFPKKSVILFILKDNHQTIQVDLQFANKQYLDWIFNRDEFRV